MGAPGCVPVAPRGREQGCSPLPSLHHQIQKTVHHLKMMKMQRNRSLQLQALGHQLWWVLVAKELPRSSQLLLGMRPRLSLAGERGRGVESPVPRVHSAGQGRTNALFCLPLVLGC